MISGTAKKMLEKHGWKEGTSLGKNGDGITSAIKVPLKMNTSGLGFQFGKEFTDDWWSSAYNAAAGSVKVSKSDSGLAVNVEKETRKRKKDGLERRFKRGGDDSEDAAAEEIPATRGNPMKEIKGITCHKAARHGIMMTGKLERIERQEREFLLTEESSKTPKKAKRTE